MRFVVGMIASALLAVACGQTATQTGVSPTPQASPAPQEVGTATLTETECDFAMPDRLPTTLLSFNLVTRTNFTGHFGLIHIDDQHTTRSWSTFGIAPVDWWRPVLVCWSPSRRFHRTVPAG